MSVALTAATAAMALAAGLATSGATAGATSPARYHYVTVALPDKPNVSLEGINDSGAYTGEGCDEGCTNVVLFVSTATGHKTFYTLPFSDYSVASFSGPSGMDNPGDVVGVYHDSDQSFHGYLRSSTGTMAEINDPEAVDFAGGGTEPEGISADGSVIVGQYYDSTGDEHGFLLRNGKFRTYDVPGAIATTVTFYYDGEFGGAFESSDGVEDGFYVIGRTVHTVSGPRLPHSSEGANAELSAMSSDGTLFGDEIPAQGAAFGFAYANGRYTTFRDPNEVGTTSEAGTYIYNADSDGAVVGAYTYTPGTTDSVGYSEGFVARPAVTPARAHAEPDR